MSVALPERDRSEGSEAQLDQRLNLRRFGSPPTIAMRLVEIAQEHWIFLAFIVAAAALRGLAWFAIHPAWWFLGDSIGYTMDALTRQPDLWRPSGYSLLVLWPLQRAHSLALVTLVQHLMGLGVGALVYATLLRLGLPSWGAALAAVPALLDGYIIASEQMLVSEPLFTLLVVGAIAVLLWRAAGPGHLAVAAAGLLLGLAALTRTVGLPLIVVALLVPLLRGVGRTRVLTLGVTLGMTFAIPVGAYATWFDRHYGQFNLNASNGIFLYGQATQFVDCGRLRLADEALRSLCPTEPVGSRNEFFYIFSVDSPIARANLSRTAANDLAGRFALQAIRAQPGDYAAMVWDRLVQSFQWGQSIDGSDLQFRTDEPMTDVARYAGYLYQGRDPGPIYRPAEVRALIAYQNVAWVPGFVCLLVLVVAAAGLVAGRDPAGRGLRAAVVPTAGSAAMLIVVPLLTTIVAGSIERYRVPAIPALCLSAGVGASLLANRWKERRGVTLVSGG